MLPEPLDFTSDYLPLPPLGGMSALNNAQLSPPQHQLLGQNQGLQSGPSLRDILLERFRSSFTGA